MNNIQSRLAHFFTEQARWRSDLADQYPDDDRNSASAAALRNVAEYIVELPDDDNRLIMIEALGWTDATGDFIAGVSRMSRPVP